MPHPPRLSASGLLCGLTRSDAVSSQRWRVAQPLIPIAATKVASAPLLCFLQERMRCCRRQEMFDLSRPVPKRNLGHSPPYLSPARFFPSIITLRKIRLMRVW